MKPSALESAGHVTLHLMKDKHAQAAALAVGGLAVKTGAVILAAPVIGPAVVLTGLGFGAYKLKKLFS